MNAEQFLESAGRVAEALQRQEGSSPIGQRLGQIRIDRQRPVKAGKGFLMAIQILQDAAAIAPHPCDGRIDGNDRAEILQRLVVAVQCHERGTTIDQRFDEEGLVFHGAIEGGERIFDAAQAM